MTITIEKKDLFTMPQGYYLAHCISADFALGAGIAKVFDKRVEEVFWFEPDEGDK